MPDYMFLLESRLSPEQRAAMLRVQELAAAMGFNVYLTGGTVRDLITGATLRDLDFSVEGNRFARRQTPPGGSFIRRRMGR
jgi:tRNA nucleotidyltransferase (CCA-adding enzyme)